MTGSPQDLPAVWSNASHGIRAAALPLRPFADTLIAALCVPDLTVRLHVTARLPGTSGKTESGAPLPPWQRAPRHLASLVALNPPLFSDLFSLSDSPQS